MLDATIGMIDKLTGKLRPGPTPRSQKMPFMFEIQDSNGALYGDLPALPGMQTPQSRFVFSVMPEQYHVTTVPRSTMTLTQSGAFLDRIGVAPVQIALSGTFGYLGEMAPAVKPQYANQPRSGYEMFTDLEQQFLTFYLLFGTYDQYCEKLKQPWSQGQPPRLCFFDFSDKHYYVVDIQRFSLNRNVHRRFLYQYDIQMTGYQKIAPTADTDAFQSFFTSGPTKPDTTTMSNFDTVVSWIKTGINATKAVKDSLVQLTTALQSDIATVTNAVQQVQGNITGIIQAPFSMVQSIINGIKQVQFTLEQFQQVPDLVNMNLNECKLDHLYLTFYPEDRFLVTGTAATPTQKVIRTETVSKNDTIRSLAVRAFGSADKWSEIAQLNKLEYPYLVADPLEALDGTTATGTLTAPAAQGATGCHISIAATAGQGIVVTSATDYIVATVTGTGDNGLVLLDKAFPRTFATGTVTIAPRQKRLLLPGDQAQIPGNPSTTFSVVDKGNVVNRMLGIDEYIETGYQPASATGDFQTISGYDNLMMQLQHRLNTRIGEMAELGHPAYGSNLPDLIGEVGTDYMYERCIHEAEIAMLADPRIESVSNMSFKVEQTAIYLTADVQPKHQTSTVAMNILVG